MGIVNVTEDSFSDGGKYLAVDSAVAHALELIADGADIIDIGGESTRPGADEINEDTELSRVLPVIEGIMEKRPNTILSIDTTKFKVAKAAVNAGAIIINDISGLTVEPRLAELAAETCASLVIMHRQGNAQTMQQNPHYNNVFEEIFAFLQERIYFARSIGVQNIIADVGIGFGKTYEHNVELLRRHKEFTMLGVPLLLGISRKRFIGEMLGIEIPEERDTATALLHALLLGSGASIIRVHNVKLISQLRRIHSEINKIIQ